MPLAQRLPMAFGQNELERWWIEISALPASSLVGLFRTWHGRETRRLDDALEIHPSWLTEALATDRPALLAFVLGALRPDLVRGVLRELWPVFRDLPSRAIGRRGPTPLLAGSLRRHLLSRFRLVLPRDQDPIWVTLLARLDGGQLLRLAQTMGQKEIQRAAETAPAEARRMLEAAPHPDGQRMAYRLQRQAGRAQTPEVTLQALGIETRQRKQATLALLHLREGVEASGSVTGEGIGCAVGIHKLASLLASVRRDMALVIAQRLPRPLARHLLTWRDSWDILPHPGLDDAIQEIRTLTDRRAHGQ